MKKARALLPYYAIVENNSKVMTGKEVRNNELAMDYLQYALTPTEIDILMFYIIEGADEMNEKTKGILLSKLQMQETFWGYK